MRIKTKGIIKKIALVLAGVVALSAVGFGIAKLVEFVKDDLKTINPVFDVGNLGADGKFVDDESTLYTKEAFECDGLQIKLDFDSQIEYQIYFYDDLDNFIESTEVLSAAYSETVHDGYARIVIMPTNDEDDKISLTERVTYPGQMTIKVAKEQNIKYFSFGGRRLSSVSNPLSLRFVNEVINYNDDGDFWFEPSDNRGSTTQQFLSVSGFNEISVYSSFVNGDLTAEFFQFSLVGSELVLLSVSDSVASVDLDKNTDYVLLTCKVYNESDGDMVLDDEILSSLPSSIVLS